MADTYHFSAPGRTEIGGNHTDHQHGCVLAAAVDMETTAEVTLTGTNIIRVDSEGYKPVEIDLNDLDARESEKNTTAALIRGVAAAFARRGYKLSGFEAKVRSTVLPGSGLSSSAAFEVLIGRILNGLFAGGAVSASMVRMWYRAPSRVVVSGRLAFTTISISQSDSSTKYFLNWFRTRAPALSPPTSATTI